MVSQIAVFYTVVMICTCQILLKFFAILHSVIHPVIVLDETAGIIISPCFPVESHCKYMFLFNDQYLQISGHFSHVPLDYGIVFLSFDYD